MFLHIPIYKITHHNVLQIHVHYIIHHNVIQMLIHNIIMLLPKENASVTVFTCILEKKNHQCTLHIACTLVVFRQPAKVITYPTLAFHKQQLCWQHMHACRRPASGHSAIALDGWTILTESWVRQSKMGAGGEEESVPGHTFFLPPHFVVRDVFVYSEQIFESKRLSFNRSQ